MLRLLAKDAVKQFGDQLIGRSIMTARFGDWPGGRAVVTKLHPDPNAPEIVCQVSSENPHNKIQSIGVFENEEIGI